VLDVIVAAALPSATTFKRQELVQLLHACGSAGLKSRVPGFPDVTWSACDTMLEQFKPHELAIVLWSFARMNYSPGDEALQRAASLLATHSGDLDMQASCSVVTLRDHRTEACCAPGCLQRPVGVGDAVEQARPCHLGSPC
jgi:hypothetical protein